MLFSKRLREAADASWEASFSHPFVTGIADGTLPLDRFKHYVLNDAYYLSCFAQVQALGAAKATDLHTSNRMAAHVQGTYGAELSLHEKFSGMLGITDEERSSFQPAPTAYAYTSHMFRAAYTGHLGDIIAAILPCYWLYYEIGERLQGAKPDEPIYREWIAAYGGEWFKELVQEQIDRLDAIADTVTEADRERMQRSFLISSRYEYLFWDMAYKKEQWPV
ncbi:thiaminase II [Paenibacillus hemerocallicola]|uniref:Aminopyrimidine aminohydrolase n=1 Tax=Paenibacillus hemerocallicola TaxID=1172614 RepID=A0A5C4SVW9_9BACL|nr:thiaminase II [Paenibacillus hemerocallicola]TNJ57651.1 thiaminase II [Paenibacillus hemerocallicola]